MKFRFLSVLALVLLFCAIFARAAQAAPTITPLQVRLCDSTGIARQTLAGEPGFIRLDWRVVGVANAPYTIRFKLAGREMIINVNSTQAGDWYAFAGWDVVPDGPLPYEIGIDPGNISGDLTPGDNLVLGTVTQTPPNTGIEYYAPRKMFGQQTLTGEWTANIGSVQSGYFWLGVPTWESFQQVVDAPGPHYADLIFAAPYNRGVWQSNFAGFTPTSANRTRSANQKVLVRNFSVRVNPNVLNNVTWTQVNNSVPADVAVWKNPDTSTTSNTLAVQQFVSNSLPAQFWTTMTPYDTAKKLFRSVVARLAYQSVAVDNRTPDSVLTVNKGDCVSFTCLYVAALRNVGIPARAITGWWDTTAPLTPGIESWHVLVEFYLPGVGWIPADPAGSDGANPAGDFAFYFGTNPTLNKFLAVSRGSQHTLGDVTTNYIQGGSCFHWGTAALGNVNRSATMAAYSAPNPVGSVRNITFGPDGRLHLLYGKDNRYSLSFVDNNGIAEYTSLGDPVAGATAIGFAAGPRNQGKLLWRTGNNAVGFWTLNSLYEVMRTPTIGPFPNYTPGNVSADWITNTTRLLWKRSDGAASVWNMNTNDETVRDATFGPFPDWEPISIAAIQNNGTFLMWRHTNGTVGIWRLDGNLAYVNAFFFQPPVGWSPKALAVGPDGKPRLVWKHADARVVLWTLRTDFTFENGIEYPYSPGWSFRDIAVDPSNNRVNLLWGHDDGTTQLWKLRADTLGIETFWWYGAF